MGHSSKNGLGYTGITNTVATTPKTVFVKVGVIGDVTTMSKTMSITVVVKTMNTPSSSKNSTPSLSKSKKRFVSIYHFCNRPGHICPKCFEYKNTSKMGRFGKYNSRGATYKHKINMKDNFVKKIWVKKIRFELSCCFYFLKDSFY